MGRVEVVSTGNFLTEPSGRTRPHMAIVRTVFLIGAMLLGLFAMHVLNNPVSVSSSMPTAQMQMLEHDPMHHAPVADPEHSSEHGCASCPMGHEMSAAGCILALLAMLLFLRPPRTVQTRTLRQFLLIPTLALIRGTSPNKPDLIALGICRT